MPICISKFGVEKFAEQDIEAQYVPHGFDDFYQPQDQAVAREALGIPADAFVVGMNMANKGGDLHRKAFGPQMQAFADFAKDRPDALLYLHTEEFGYMRGWNLRNYAAALDIEDKVMFADQMTYRLGVPAEAMPYLYSSFDVLMNATMGEGFGIPIIEAQACGVPVIVTDTTAMSELVGPGWRAGGEKWWHETSQSWWINPSIGELVDALEDAYETPSLADVAVEFAEPYRASNVMSNHWLPVLENMAERINPQAVAA
jgi:glycosyltransferase involved in cell wall biosynthesis